MARYTDDEIDLLFTIVGFTACVVGELCKLTGDEEKALDAKELSEMSDVLLAIVNAADGRLDDSADG